MNKRKGFTLIEIVVFIIVLAITATASMIAYTTVLSKANQPGQILAASQLANARMSLILQQALVNGFASIVDPCVASPPAACTGLSTFATTNGYTVSSSIPAASGGVRTATVTVTGAGNATVVMRFVQ